MKITMARIDNRLLHGIVIAQYLPQADCQRIMVIDDEVANNPKKKEMMMFAKPDGYAASIIPLAKALENFKNNKYEGQRIFILAKTPQVFAALLEIGVPIPELIIGATDRLNEGIKLSNRAYISEEEADVCRHIQQLGTRIIVQHAPSVTPVELSKIIH